MADFFSFFRRKPQAADQAPAMQVATEFSSPATEMQAATDLPPQAPPKRLSNKQLTSPSYITTAKPNPETALTITDRRLANTDITTLRAGSNTRSVLRDFRLSSPDLSAAVAAYLRTGIPNTYTCIAYNPDGTVNPEATQAAAAIITRLDVLNDYTIGFDSDPSIRSVSESWGVELVTYGSCSGELVLDKSKLPSAVAPISVTQIKFYPSSDGKRKIPQQELSGLKINLDIPTFFYVSLDQDLLDPYSISPIETALQPVLFSADFLNDVRRIVKKVIHPRQVVTIDEELFRKSLPLEVQTDQTKLDEHLEGVLSELQNKINTLAPEDALVFFSSIGIQILDRGNTSLDREYDMVQGMADAKLSAGTRVLPTVLGKAGGTSNTASAEVLLFMKTVEGTIWAKLNEMWSKLMTLAVRLMGHDVSVRFEYDPIDLRPTHELESFKAMRQSRILELLSLGLMSDEEASIRLTGHLPPAGYEPKSGTGFRPGTSVQPAGDGFNGASNSGSTMNQKIKSDAPKNAKSQNGGKPGAEIINLTN